MKKCFLLLSTQTALLLGCALLRSGQLLFQTTGTFFWKVFYQRGRIPVCIGCLLLIVLTLLCFRGSAKKPLFQKKNVLKFFAMLLLCVLCGVLIFRTRVGLEKENAFYGKPTVPLLEWHIAAAFLVCLSWLLIEWYAPEGIPEKILKLMPLVIWLAAVVIWLGIPNQNGFFSPAGRAPNYETYPFSDGSFYGHYARSAAAGMGFKGDDIPPRPLYLAMLTFFHLLGKYDYDTVIVFQTLLCALLPMTVYLIGKEVHSVGAGLFAAILVILRETHSILSAPFGHNISTTKYFFADIPMALACAFFFLMLIRWLRAGRREQGGSGTYALLCGCALGILALIRTQGLFLALLLTAVLFNRRQKKSELLLCAAAFLVCIAPWLVRNYRITGKFVFDHPATQTAELARSYNFDNADLSQREGENDGEYNQRLSDFIAEMLQEHPREILSFFKVHFVNNILGNLRLFPLRQELSDPQELLRSSSPFWETLDTGELDPYNLVFFVLSLMFLLGGIISAGDLGAEGILPLLGVILFNLSTALGRYSAGRYLIPMDWAVMLYFAAGCTAWLESCAEWSGIPKRTLHERTVIPYRFGAVMLILLTAAAIPLAVHAIPPQLVPASAEEVRSVLSDVTLPCKENEQVWTKAIAIYPRWYAAGEGEPESAKQGYGVTDHGRLVFLTLAPDCFGTFELPTETPPDAFPDGSTVYIGGCRNGPTTTVIEVRGEK